MSKNAGFSPCPVPLERLAELMRLKPEGAALAASSLTVRQRAELALYCFARMPLRSLALQLAPLCGESALVACDAAMGAALIRQMSAEFDASPARCAAG